MTRPMTCDELDPIAREAARALAPDRQHPVAPDVPGAETPSEEVLQSVREHLRGCPACTRRLEDERHLDARLSTLASADEPPPPPTLEQRLTHAHRARFGGTSPPPSPADGRGRTILGGPTHGALRATRPHVPLTAAAVVIAAAAAVTLWWRQRSPDPMVALQDRTGLPVPAEERPALPVRSPLDGRTDPAGRGTAVEVVVRAGDGRAQAAAFVPLGWDTAVRPIEIGRVTRVRMPTSIAARFGWPLLPDAPEARVAADVLVGEDGTARALRFLPATFAPVSHDSE